MPNFGKQNPGCLRSRISKSQGHLGLRAVKAQSATKGRCVTLGRPVEGDDPVVLKNLGVMLSAFDPIGVPGVRSAAAGSDGAFHMENISPDRYRVVIGGLTGNRYLKSVRTGGADATTSGLDLTAGSPGPVDIVLGNAARISGAVKGEKSGLPLIGAVLLLVPQAKEKRGQEEYYKVTTTGADGRFGFPGIPPGAYQVLAWEQTPEDVVYTDPDFIKLVEDRGKAVTVREGDRPDLQVVAIPTGAR
jgi:hypothetical protein